MVLLTSTETLYQFSLKKTGILSRLNAGCQATTIVNMQYTDDSLLFGEQNISYPVIMY